jgi:hypothetical protein
MVQSDHRDPGDQWGQQDNKDSRDPLVRLDQEVKVAFQAPMDFLVVQVSQVPQVIQAVLAHRDFQEPWDRKEQLDQLEKRAH